MMDEDSNPKKGIAAMLIAGKGPSMEDDMEDSEDEVSGEDIAVEDMMMAMQDNDVQGFKIALNAFLDQR